MIEVQNPKEGSTNTKKSFDFYFMSMDCTIEKVDNFYEAHSYNEHKQYLGKIVGSDLTIVFELLERKCLDNGGSRLHGKLFHGEDTKEIVYSFFGERPYRIYQNGLKIEKVYL